MGDIAFNISKGKVKQYFQLSQEGTASQPGLVAVAFTGTETDANLKDFDTLAQVEASALAECVLAGYTRKVLTGVTAANGGADTVGVNDSTDAWEGDSLDITWTGVVAGTAWTRIGIFYCPNIGTGGVFTGASSDTLWIPLTMHDFAQTPDGSVLVAQVANLISNG